MCGRSRDTELFVPCPSRSVFAGSPSHVHSPLLLIRLIQYILSPLKKPIIARVVIVIDKNNTQLRHVSHISKYHVMSTQHWTISTLCGSQLWVQYKFRSVVFWWWLLVIQGSGIIYMWQVFSESSFNLYNIREYKSNGPFSTPRFCLHLYCRNTDLLCASSGLWTHGLKIMLSVKEIHVSVCRELKITI